MALLAGTTHRRIASAVLIATATLTGILSAQATTETSTAPSEAFAEALNAYDQAWEAADLAFTKTTFTEGASTGYGQYRPRENATFSDGEALFIYAEPVGYGFQENGSEYAYELTASYKLLNLSGQVLAKEDNFAVFSGNGRSKKREIAASLNFRFSGLPAGEYRLETDFTDTVGGGRSGFVLPFTISAAD
ncbi:hypothetical protein [Roseibium salinum]|uniref:Uncharacterized protein n=1 Tax=Roseibium salinum TaxID=1604349 RepID=A0ABT3R3U8_9HYPH|nr:hypothetical protein [Roseibium sp. DSM 29163]MCX2723870.1 hypothetical protein [Roseibium sp. DSM 29163]